MSKPFEMEILLVLQHIHALMSKEMITVFVNTEEKDLAIFHFGFGAWIRNHILSENSEIYRLFTENGIEHKDDMSAALIKGLYQILQRYR